MRYVIAIIVLASCGPADPIEKGEACELNSLPKNVAEEPGPTIEDGSIFGIEPCHVCTFGTCSHAGLWDEDGEWVLKCQYESTDEQRSCMVGWCANMCTGEALK